MEITLLRAVQEALNNIRKHAGAGEVCVTLTYFEDLVVAGHVYILETPLFRVRNKKATIYCYTERERARAVKKLKSAEITRFKGLGEISPKEFAQFIGADMRLVKVDVRSMSQVPDTLSFYMGKNTPERREYIMENLV